MSKVLLLAVNDLRRTMRDRASLAWLFVMPVALMWFFGQIGGGGGGADPKISLAVADRDGGWLARALVRELTDDSVALFELDEEGRPIGEEAAGKSAIRTLVIPEGFTRGALAGEQQTLRLELSPRADSEFGLAAQVHIVRAAGRLVGRLVELNLAGKDLSDPAAPDYFVMLAGERPAVTLDVSTAGVGKPVPSGFAQSVPGILTMTVLMMTLIVGASFLASEKQEGMLRRQMGLPITGRRLFLGKLTGRLLLAAVQIVVLVLVGRLVFGLSFGSSPLGLLLLLVSYAFAVAALALWIGAAVRAPEQAEPISWLSSMLMAGLGGCWWPSEVMPGWLRSAAHVFPTAWAMDGFHALISFGYGVSAVALPAAVLTGFGLLFSWLGARWLEL